MIIWSVIADILSLSSFAAINIPIYIFKYLTLDSPMYILSKYAKCKNCHSELHSFKYAQATKLTIILVILTSHFMQMKQ